MKKQDIKMVLLKCFEKTGIYIDENGIEEIQLDNYTEDSIQFITLIVEIESAFNIEIPDELLVITNFKSIDAVCNMLDGIIYGE